MTTGRINQVCQKLPLTPPTPNNAWSSEARTAAINTKLFTTWKHSAWTRVQNTAQQEELTTWRQIAVLEPLRTIAQTTTTSTRKGFTHLRNQAVTVPNEFKWPQSAHSASSQRKPPYVPRPVHEPQIRDPELAFRTTHGGAKRFKKKKAPIPPHM